MRVTITPVDRRLPRELDHYRIDVETDDGHKLTSWATYRWSARRTARRMVDEARRRQRHIDAGPEQLNL